MKGMSKGGKLCLQSYGRVQTKEENNFGSTYINHFWIIDPFAAKILQENCFSDIYVILLISKLKKKKSRGRVGKGNKHLLSQALSWEFPT